jgi:hypothetical protein
MRPRWARYCRIWLGSIAVAKLEKSVHVALDELRMQMLGAQVLFGFQLQGVFQDGFASVSGTVRLTDAAALILMVLTIGFLLSAPSQHRLVEGGEATAGIFHVANRFAELALLTFALALGCDFYVVMERYWGTTLALSGAVCVALVSFALWFALGAGLRMVLPKQETTKPLPPQTGTSLHEKIDQMLTETRVVLPGAQALLGFQFVVTMTKAFAALPYADRAIHFMALAAVALAIMLLLTPAAVHRLTFRGEDVARFHAIGSRLVTIALAPLALGITADFYVAAGEMLKDRALAVSSACLTALFLFTLWYAVPYMLRHRYMAEQR